MRQYRSRHATPFLALTDELPMLRPDGVMVGLGRGADDPVAVALGAITTRLRGRWLGRSQESDPERPTELWAASLRQLAVDAADLRGYQSQHGATIWPIFHDLVAPADYHVEWRRAYRRVNLAYARAAAQQVASGGMVWVHGHHLQLVPVFLRGARPDLRVGLYLPTPFPAPELFRRLPMWRELLAGLIHADHLGFQTARSAENFLRVAEATVAEAGAVTVPSVGVYPTSVDTTRLTELSLRAGTAARAAAVRSSLGDPSTVLLSLSPAGAAQGVEQRLDVIESLYRDGRLRAGEAVVVLIVTDDDAGLAQTHDEIALRVARINGEFASVGRPCVHHVRESPGLAERVSYYQAADLMLATPLREAATPFALEFAVAARPDAALLLSEFSGTAETLADAYVVNPYDFEETADAVISALVAPRHERIRRMELMRPYPVAYDTHSWATHFALALHTNTYRRPCPAEPEQDRPKWPVQRSRAPRDDQRWLSADPGAE